VWILILIRIFKQGGMVVPRVCSPGMARTYSGGRPCRPVPRSSSQPRANFPGDTAGECPVFSSPGVFQVRAIITRRPAKSGQSHPGGVCLGKLFPGLFPRTLQKMFEMKRADSSSNYSLGTNSLTKPRQVAFQSCRNTTVTVHAKSC
jgi:hypothetical protein